jgi:hypothetical protein
MPAFAIVVVMVMAAARAVCRFEELTGDGGKPFAQFPAEFFGVCLLAGLGDASQVKTDSHDGCYFFPGE